MITGNPPYRKLPKEEAICNIIENESPPIPERLSQRAHQFLSKCFIKNPSKRESISNLLSHPWIQSNLLKESNYSSSCELKSNESQVFTTIHDILNAHHISIDLHEANSFDLSNETFQRIINEDSQSLLHQFLVKKQNHSISDIFNIPIDDLRLKLAELEVENKILVSTCENIQETLTNQLVDVSSHLQQSNFDLEESQLRKSSIAKKICILEESYANVQSDETLAKLIYGSKIPISHFTSGIRGVLLLKRGGKLLLFLSLRFWLEFPYRTAKNTPYRNRYLFSLKTLSVEKFKPNLRDNQFVNSQQSQ